MGRWRNNQPAAADKSGVIATRKREEKAPFLLLLLSLSLSLLRRNKNKAEGKERKKERKKKLLIEKEERDQSNVKDSFSPCRRRHRLLACFTTVTQRISLGCRFFGHHVSRSRLLVRERERERDPPTLGCQGNANLRAFQCHQAPRPRQTATNSPSLSLSLSLSSPPPKKKAAV